MAQSFLRSERSKASACRSVIFGENRSPGNSRCLSENSDKHRLLPHEKLTENLSEAQADSLLRCDLERCLNVFRKYGKDSLLLSLLGFNVGCYRLIGNGKIPKSRLIQKLESGDRDIYREYISFRCYRGKVIPGIERRRKEEFELFYIP